MRHIFQIIEIKALSRLRHRPYLVKHGFRWVIWGMRKKHEGVVSGNARTVEENAVAFVYKVVVAVRPDRARFHWKTKK